MNQTHLEVAQPPLPPYIMIALALVGLADAFYLAHASYTGSSISCAIFEGCDIVARSPYSHAFGVPLSFFGVMFYLCVIGFSVLLAYDPRSRGMRLGAVLLTLVGLADSIYFEYLQVFVIHAICMYCLISAITTLLLFAVAVWHFKKTR